MEQGVVMVWPRNQAGEVLREMLAADGMLDYVARPRFPSGPAVLRPVVLVPRRMRYKTLRYSAQVRRQTAPV